MKPLTPSRFLPAAGLFTAWLVIVHRTLLAGETYFLRDFWTNYVPTRHILREAFSRFTLPLWNPWIAGGTPVIPDPNHGVFYLPAWPFLLFKDQAWALSVATDVHTLLAAVGTYVLARRWASRAGAIVAASAFGFGGLLLTNVINAHWHFGWAWAPLWFWAVARLMDAPGARRAAAVGGIWALQLLSAEPQVAYLEGLALPLLWMGRLWETPAENRKKQLVSLAWLTGALGVAVLVAAPQLAGLFEALGQSDRPNLTLKDASVWSYHAGRLWELVLPQPWGVHTPVTTFWGGHLVNGPWYGFYFASLYMGALALPLACLGVRPMGKRHIIVAVGVFVLWLSSMGEDTPVFGALRSVVPLWRTFRYPERFVLLPTLALAVLMARGVDAALTLKRWQGALALALPGVVAALAAAVPTLLGAKAGDAGASATITTAATHAGLVALAAVLFVGGLGEKAPRAPLLAGLVVLDLVVVSPWALATWTPPEPSTLLAGEPERVLFSTLDITSASQKLPRRPSERRRFEDAMSRPNLGIQRNIRSVSGVTSMEFTRTRLLREAVGLEEAAVRFQARHAVADGRHTFRLFSPVQPLGLGIELFRHEGPLPPVTCVGAWQPAPTTAEAIRIVKSGHVAENTSAPASPGLPEVPCTLERLGSSEMRLSLPAQARDTLAIVSESYYPGWRTSTPGATVIPADVAMLGVHLPAGTTEVKLQFRPGWLWPSLVASVVGLLALAAALLKRTSVLQRA